MIEKIGTFFIGHANAATFNFFGFASNYNTNNVSNAQTATDSLIGNVVTWVLAIVGVLAFIYLIISGVNYITAGGDAAKATTARQGIINAIIGIVIVLLAWVIVSFAFNLGGSLSNGVQ